MTKKWKLYTKMTLWFALSVSVIVSLLFGAVYGAMALALDRSLRDDLALAVEQIGAQVERSNGALVYENETPIAPAISYYVMEANGSELFSHGQDIACFDDVSIAEGSYLQASVNGEPWLLLDAAPIVVAGETIRIRVAASCAENRRTLHALSAVFAIGFPLATALAALVGSILARHSLKPLRQIISCANEISAGNFAQRVPTVSSRDELGELADTLNRMLAAQEASLQRERQFTSDASHELRTPVAVMLATAENLLAQETLSAEQTAQINTVLAECRRMQRMIEQMLTLTRAQSGRCTFLWESVSLADMLEGIRLALDDAMAQKHITLTCAVPEGLTLQADQSLLTRLMLNLLENAVKYGRNGGRIVCKAQRRGEQCELIVRDNGIGISAADLPHVFDRFYRADTARDRSGTGLGLSIARWIVEAHHGQISIQSKEGSGTAVIIILPCSQANL